MAVGIRIHRRRFCSGILPVRYSHGRTFGACFALFGSLSFEVGRKVYYQLWMLTYLIIGFLFPGTNAWVHLYCYLAGCLIALLNKPVKVG